MASRLPNEHLLRISKGTAAELNGFGYGIFVHTQSGLTLDDLIKNAVKDRFNLAKGFLRSAQKINKQLPSHHRVVLAKSYYSMYHAARALAFFAHGGDDHEAHSEVFKQLPGDFNDRNKWQNEIKNARLERNRADYDPYPKGDSAFSSSAKTTLSKAENFVPIVRIYLRRKGCSL